MPIQVVSYLSPTGGWNSFNARDNMPETDAVILDNFFPEMSYVRLRNGYTTHCDTGAGAHNVGTLMTYNSGTTSVLLAACNGHIYDVSTNVPASLVAGKGSDIWSFTNYRSSGSKLLAANASGLDKPIVYDGATIADVAVTGVTDTSLSMVHIYMLRTFYVQKDTLSVWYTTAGAYQGALTEFDFGPLCTKGGSIAAVNTWTRDNGFGGSDDLFVVVTTEGEVLLYSGTNPGDASAWSMSGRFVVGTPVAGPHCVVSTGPEMILLCEDGFQPLSQYLSLGESRATMTNLAQKINKDASDAVQLYGSNTGWQGLLYPRGTALYINIPVDTSAGTYYQYVVNTATGSWCRYTGMNATSWAVFNNAPYFGGTDGKVYLSDNGPADGASDIVGEICTAFKYAGSRGVQKRFTLARPVLQVSGNLRYTMDVATDFDTSETLPTVSFNYSSGSLWGTGLWGTSIWGQGNTSLFRRWSSVSGLGFASAVRLKVSTQSIAVKVNSFDIGFEMGGLL